MASNTLARAAVHLAALVLTRDRSTGHQCFRVKNLHEDEVVQFSQAWPEAARAAGLDKVSLVIAGSLGGRISDTFVAEAGRSITHYRNHNPHGLVYVETSVQSDEQGLQNMFSLRDSNFLDGSFDEYVSPLRSVPSLLIEEAWKTTGSPHQVPDLLLDGLLQVVRLVHPGIEPVPVRRFVEFAETACREWTRSEQTKDEAEADRIIGHSLSALEMFPDPDWRRGLPETKVRRRIELNARHADLIDGSKELDADEVGAKARVTQFRDRQGAPLPVDQVRQWQELCAAYGLTSSGELRREIPYWVFSQLFVKDTAGLRLGDRVRAELERSAPQLLPDLDSLDVVSGLNSRNTYDAGRLLEALPSDGTQRIADLLDPATRKSVERLATPPRKRFFNPAIEIVRLLQRVTADARGNQVAKVHLELDQEGLTSPSRGLFAFLFGDTIKLISELVNDVPGSCQLTAQPELLELQEVPELRDSDDDDDESASPLVWDALPLRITSSDQAGKILDETEIEWCPQDIEHFALMWLLVAADDSPALGTAATLRMPRPTDGDDWVGPLAQREASLNTLTVDPAHRLETPHVLLDELASIRRELRNSLRAGGLAIGALRAFLDGWQSLVTTARLDFVPEGVRSRELDAFLGCDLLGLAGEERRVMLPLHPLRLRWVCFYLEETRKLASAFLSREATFADGEGGTFLDWLESLTPRESPPLAVGQDGQLLYSRSETAWFEDFSPERTETADAGLDSNAIESIARRIVGYLDAHPYKRDGLSLLIVLPTSDSMPAELLKRVSVRANRSARVSLFVAAPKVRWEAIARQLELLSNDSDDAPQTRLFPDRDLALIDYQAGGDLSAILADLQLDIAVVTHILQERVVSQQNTEAPIQRSGRFDPLHHRPLRLETSSGGGAISLVMLPKYPDPMLEAWSTLAVRANRCRPVAPGQPENTDLIELRINFQDSARLFKDLHEHCHWVITLERHISREQIESVEAGQPDVLSIEEGVGSNRLSTLVVSSRSGRALAKSRIMRKLARLVPPRQLLAHPPEALQDLADAIYDSTRHLSPRLALQALGVARVTEEIVGLTVARRLTEDKFPVGIAEGLSAWISLDDHTEWFGGPLQVRADMCRMSIERSPDGWLDVDILVLEGKLRQSYDAHGVVQVRRTRDFFRGILGTERDGGPPPVDASMWRELIASAIETLPEPAVEFYPAAPTDGRSEDLRRRDLLLSDFRSGRVRLRRVDGIYSACLWESDELQVTESVEQEVVVLRSTRAHLMELARPRGLATSMASSVTTDGPDDAPSVSPLTDGGDVQGLAAAGVATPSALPAPAPATTSAGASGVEIPYAPGAESASLSKAAEGPPSFGRGLSEADRQRMYETILGCFARYSIPVSAAQPSEQPVVEGPASVLFKVRPGAGIDPKKLSEKSAALKLTLALDQEQNVSFNIDKGFVTIDVPKRQEDRYFIAAEDTWSRWSRPSDALAVPIGEDSFGELVTLDFSSANTPHLLVAGTTGSGKSEALNTVLFGLVHHYSTDELRLMLVDPKGTELLKFEDSAYLEGRIGWEDKDALELLKRAVEEMQRRYVLFRTAAVRSLAEFNASRSRTEHLPWWLIVLDEYADLTGDPQAKREIEAELKRLAQKARAAGIHIIIATQKPSAEVISTNLRSNLPAQLALRVKSATESRVVMDEAGAENLNGKGDAILKADGKLRRVQCSRVGAAVGVGGSAI